VHSVVEVWREMTVNRPLEICHICKVYFWSYLYALPGQVKFSQVYLAATKNKTNTGILDCVQDDGLRKKNLCLSILDSLQGR
jgi:hypothetical protein